MKLNALERCKPDVVGKRRLLGSDTLFDMQFIRFTTDVDFTRFTTDVDLHRKA